MIKGASSSLSSEAIYFAKTIDWPNGVIRDIILPTEIKDFDTDLALSDEFLYVVNK